MGGFALGFLSGRVITDRYLSRPSISFKCRNEEQCVKQCVKTDLCRTINIGPGIGDGSITCELIINSTVYIYSGSMKYRVNWKIISVGVSININIRGRIDGCIHNYQT